MRKKLIKIIASILFVRVRFDKSIFIDVECNSERAIDNLNQLSNALQKAGMVAEKLNEQLIKFPIETDFVFTIKKDGNDAA